MRRTRSQTKAISGSQHPQSPSTIAVSVNPSSSSSKVSFRAQKIRKVTPEAPNNKDFQVPKAEASRVPSLAGEKTIAFVEKAPSESHSILPMIGKPLTLKGEIDLALQHLRKSDSLLATCIDAFRPPEFVADRQPFLSLTKGIICLQLSNKAAKTINDRFVSLCGSEDSVRPDTVLGFSAQQLRECGLSGQKASYLHDLSSKYRDGFLSDSSILEMDDETLFNKLTMVKGIGPWSVHMFMIFTLHRPDVLPVGDLVIRRGVERLYGLKALPQPSQVEKLCETIRE